MSRKGKKRPKASPADVMPELFKQLIQRLKQDEESGKQKVSIALDGGVVEAMRELAEADKRSFSAAINEALGWYIRDRAMAALIERGEEVTDADREAVLREWSQAQ